ncbi:hypothetical protein QBC43DRAFT_331625 [Cladorrhinum sp. PSN259]|nr:hypothetical protein QBC43DRAFT_331625 [Cladorrhinum sp. PSN259]
MKSVATLFLAVAGASVVAAQLNQCGIDCTNRVIAQATTDVFKCAGGDSKCLCDNANFWYGIRDCASQACGGQAASEAQSWGENYCKSAAATLNTGTGAATPGPTPSESASPSGSESASPSESESGAPTTIISAISTTTFISTVSESGSAVTTVSSESTVFSTDLVSTSAIVSTVSESSTTFETTVGFTTVTTEAPSQSNGGATSSSTSRALGAQVTAAPVIGFIAAAGLAAALL